MNDAEGKWIDLRNILSMDFEPGKGNKQLL